MSVLLSELGMFHQNIDQKEILSTNYYLTATSEIAMRQIAALLCRMLF